MIGKLLMDAFLISLSFILSSFCGWHQLFELRVNRAVCQFVTIIVQIFSKIRVFFIIFLVGILAFTLALSHLLRGCVQEPCPAPSTGFPPNPYEAFSATFFFMVKEGGDKLTSSHPQARFLIILSIHLLGEQV